MTSRIGVPLFTRMTVISPVFLLWALTVIMPSSPDDGAAADGRLLVDVTEFVLLVTEFLLSFVGTLAGLKLSSDIACQLFRNLLFCDDARMRTARGLSAFRPSLFSKRIFTGFGCRRSACWQRFGCRTVSTRSRAHSVAHASSQSVGPPVELASGPVRY